MNCGYNDNSSNIIRQEESRASEMKAQRASKLQKGNTRQNGCSSGYVYNGYVVSLVLYLLFS